MKKKTILAVDFLASKKPLPKYIFSNRLSLVILTLGIFLLPQIAYFSSITPEKIIELTNNERRLVNIKPLTANQLLTKAAYLKGQAILETQTFQHTIGDRKFSSWVRESGYNYSYVGENLAIDFMTSEGIINAWLKSPSHKNNLLNPDFSEIGIAAIEGKFQGQNSVIVVQVLGNPINNVAAEQKITNNQAVFLEMNERLPGNTYIDSTPIIYISNPPIMDAQKVNLLIIKMSDALYVLRYLPLATSIMCLFWLSYIFITRIFDNFKAKEAKE